MMVFLSYSRIIAFFSRALQSIILYSSYYLSLRYWQQKPSVVKASVQNLKIQGHNIIKTWENHVVDMMLRTDEGIKFSEIGLTICEILGFRGCVVKSSLLWDFSAASACPRYLYAVRWDRTVGNKLPTDAVQRTEERGPHIRVLLNISASTQVTVSYADSYHILWNTLIRSITKYLLL